jgi:hypothetical protein
MSRATDNKPKLPAIRPENGNPGAAVPRPALPSFDLQSLHVPQAPNSGVNAIWGQWPGEETDEEFTAAMKDL